MGMGGFGNVSGGGSGFIKYHTIPELSNAHSPYTVSIFTTWLHEIGVNIHGTGGYDVELQTSNGIWGTQRQGGDGYSGGKTAI